MVSLRAGSATTPLPFSTAASRTWNAREYPVTAAPAQPVRDGTVTIRLRPELLVDAQYVHAHLKAAEMQLLDARVEGALYGRNGAARSGRRTYSGRKASLVQRKFQTRPQAQITRGAARRFRTSRPRSNPNRASMRLRRLLSGQSTRNAARRLRRFANLQRIVERMDRRPVTPHCNGIVAHRRRVGRSREDARRSPPVRSYSSAFLENEVLKQPSMAGPKKSDASLGAPYPATMSDS